MMAKVDWSQGPDERYFMDHWNGYDAARSRLLEALSRLPSRNAVVLSGDLHSSWVNDLKLNFADPKSPTVATELIGTSISSGGDGVDLPENMRALVADNPIVKFYNGERGHVSCELAAGALRADFKVVARMADPARFRPEG
jgi:alkaline phosphatase D